MTDNTVVIDTPAGMEFFKLAQVCGRLGIETSTGLKFRQSTLAAVKRYYGLKCGTKKRALEILTEAKQRVLAGEDIYSVLGELQGAK